uniref:Uncharacterized protein n=1 Tax=Cannabis sativa TaxID=3483 RepID=A0A803PJV2_CANSA
MLPQGTCIFNQDAPVAFKLRKPSPLMIGYGPNGKALFNTMSEVVPHAMPPCKVVKLHRNRSCDGGCKEETISTVAGCWATTTTPELHQREATRDIINKLGSPCDILVPLEVRVSALASNALCLTDGHKLPGRS